MVRSLQRHATDLSDVPTTPGSLRREFSVQRLPDHPGKNVHFKRFAQKQPSWLLGEIATGDVGIVSAHEDDLNSG